MTRPQAGGLDQQLGSHEGEKVDVSGHLVVRGPGTTRLAVIKGLALDGPILLPPAADLPFLARPFTADEVARAKTLAEQNRTRLEGPVLPIQVLGSGPFINASVDNGLERASHLLGMTVDEVKNRATISGAVEIGRLPGFIEVNLLVPQERLERIGIAELVLAQYGTPAGW